MQSIIHLWSLSFWNFVSVNDAHYKSNDCYKEKMTIILRLETSQAMYLCCRTFLSGGLEIPL